MFRKPALAIVLMAVFLWTCSEESEPLKPISVSSVTPGKAVEGETVKIIVRNMKKDKPFVSISIGGQIVTPTSIADSTITIAMPFFAAGGMKSIDVRFNGESFSAADALEYLPLEFIGVSDPVLNVRQQFPNGDTILVKAINIPKNIKVGSTDGFQVWREVYRNGTLEGKLYDGGTYLFIKEILYDKGIVLQLRADPSAQSDFRYKFFIRYRDTEFAMSDLSFPGYFKIWKGSYNNVPEGEILLYQGSRQFSTITSGGFQSNVYLGGVKLRQYYHDPIEKTAEGYTAIEAFAVPAGIGSGEHTLTVFELDGSTPIKSDSAVVTLKISDISYCPEKSTYAKGEEIKVNVYPYMYPYRCYSCPQNVTMASPGGTPEFTTKVKTIGYNDENSSYFILTQDATMPPGIYKFNIKSPNGYSYKVKEGCTTSVVTVTN